MNTTATKITKPMARVLGLIATNASKWNATQATMQAIVDGGLAVYVDWKGWELTPAGRAAIEAA